MVISKKFKLILSQIKVAQCNYKKVLKLNIFSADLVLLNLLWKNNLIYGFTKLGVGYAIFLKYTAKGNGLLTSLFFLKGLVSKKKLINLLLLDPLVGYIVLTNQGVYFYSIFDLKYVNGGILIAKL